jgi:hypothetical protein
MPYTPSVSLADRLRGRSLMLGVSTALAACAAVAATGLPLRAIPAFAFILENCMISG